MMMAWDGAVRLDTAKFVQWLCCTATTQNRQRKNATLATRDIWCLSSFSHTFLVIKDMSKPNKQTYKQSNAAIARTFRHQSSLGFTSESSSTRASTLAAITPSNSAPPSTIDPSDSPALNSWDQ
jgi:hypothetical protein